VLGAFSAAGEVYVAEVGKKATLDCGVTVFRSNLEWRKNNVKIISQLKTGITSKGTHNKWTDLSLLYTVTISVCLYKVA